jgi:hypothetical protein
MEEAILTSPCHCANAAWKAASKSIVCALAVIAFSILVGINSSPADPPPSTKVRFAVLRRPMLSGNGIPHKR